MHATDNVATVGHQLNIAIVVFQYNIATDVLQCAVALLYRHNLVIHSDLQRWRITVEKN